MSLSIYYWSMAATLHTAAAPAVRAAVKTQVSYRNDTIIGRSEIHQGTGASFKF